MNKTNKILQVENLKEQLKTATSVVLIDYTGLTVKAQQDLKKRLAEVGAKMEVVKNTLLKLAGKEAGTPDEVITDTVLSGPVAIVVTQGDPIAPLQVLSKFAKEFEIPNLKVGIVEGKLQDKDALTILSTLPGKDVLFAQVTGAIGAPLYGLVGTLQGNLQKLVYILKEASGK